MRGSGTMYRKRKRAYRTEEVRRSAGAWERIWMRRGAVASASLASLVVVVMAAVAFPKVAALAFVVFLALAAIAAYVAVICNDVGFDGELKK